MTSYTFPPETLPKKEVEKTLDDWVKKLNRLFDQLEQWRKEYCPDAEVTRFEREQMVEPLMSSARVRPRNVPFYTITRGKKRISFVPSSRWIAGANGRVNLTTNRIQRSLIDVGEGSRSNWMLVTANIDHPIKPFDKEAFARLVKEEL